MAKLEENVVLVTVLDGIGESEILMGGSSFRTAGSEVVDDDGGSFIVPTDGKVTEVEKIIPNCRKTVLVASLNGHVLGEQKITRDNDYSCSGNGKSEVHEFIVGDFVWCKIMNQVMPAQVYDPKVASDFALRHRREGCLYVLLFGDEGTCAWCLPTQLLPFVDNFIQMSRDCSSKHFLKAVEKAVEEFERIVGSGVVCKCVSKSQMRGLARPMRKVTGLKAGVRTPEVDVNRILVPTLEPHDVLANVCHIAKTISLGNKLHLATLKGGLSSFYLSKGYQLPLYSELIYTQGFAEENIISRKPDGTKVAVDGDISIEMKHEKANVLTSRKRKKSRYLCHPYISPFPLPDVQSPVEELLAEIQRVAVKPLHLYHKGSIDKLREFFSAVRSSTYIHGSNFKSYQKSITGQKQKKSWPSQSKISTAVRKTSTEMKIACDTNGFISNAKYVTRKLEKMTYVLENCHNTFSVEEKGILKEDIKQIMKSVENVSEKVNCASKKVRIDV